MKPIALFQLQEVKGGPLVGLMQREGVWIFTFHNALSVEAHSGWRLFDPAAKNKTIVGCRDLLSLDDPLAEVQRHIQGYELGAFHFQIARDSLDLGLFDADLNHLKVEINKTSVRQVNWRIIGEDFEDDDQKKIIERL